MATLLDQDYIQNRISRATLSAIFDDDNDGGLNSAALTDIADDAEAEVYSFIKRNYPNVTVPITSSVPATLRSAAFEFFFVWAMDRKIEYWSGRQEGEREARLKAAYEKAARYAKAEQLAWDTAQPKPTNVGTLIGDTNTDTVTGELKPRLFENTGIF